MLMRAHTSPLSFMLVFFLFFNPSVTFCTLQHFDPSVNPHTSWMAFQNQIYNLSMRFVFAEGLDIPRLETIGSPQSVLLPRVHSSSVSLNYVV